MARRLSQTQLGEHLGVTFQQIQKYERGTNRVSGARPVLLCEILDVKPEQILGNGHGVFADEPEVLAILQDKEMGRMLMAINRIPRQRRRAVVRCLWLLVSAFEQPTGAREDD